MGVRRLLSRKLKSESKVRAFILMPVWIRISCQCARFVASLQVEYLFHLDYECLKWSHREFRGDSAKSKPRCPNKNGGAVD